MFALSPNVDVLAVMVVFLPLCAFVLCMSLARFLPAKALSGTATGLLTLAAFASWGLFLPVLLGNQPDLYPVTITLCDWISLGALRVSWAIYVDALSVTMMVVVTTVSALVHLYSMEYMQRDPALTRFMGYLSFFTFTMLMLVVSRNLLQVFFGWEGVGLASYLLIGFWFTKDSANAASIKAFVVNRVGDVGLALGIVGCYWAFNTVDIPEILTQLPAAGAVAVNFAGYEFHALEVLALLLFIGAMGKSAQFGLHVWLPDAMEGPTPVSALIHAATMVTAGVFLLCRLGPLYEMTETAKAVIVVIGAVSAFFAGTIALVQEDIKRIIAYSTCSQLGYMFIAAGLGAYNIALFHLVTHAFFKALLFLSAGAIIHAVSDEQNIEKMGGLRKLIPSTYVMVWIGSLALAGVPIFAGFYSKDAIIMSAYLSTGLAAKAAFALGLVGALLTAFYSWRLIIKCFHGISRLDEKTLAHVHEPGWMMRLPLMLLSIGAIFSGLGLVKLFFEPDAWGDSLVVNRETVTHTISALVHFLPLMLAAAGIAVAYLFYHYRPEYPRALVARLPRLYNFLCEKWFFDRMYACTFVAGCKRLGQVFYTGGDQKVIDHYGPNGFARLAVQASRRFSIMQTGYLNHYVLIMILGAVLLAAILGLLHQKVDGF